MEELRAAAAVTDAQKAAEISIQKAIADWDRILARHIADMRQQIEQAMAAAQAQATALQHLAAAKASPARTAKTGLANSPLPPTQRPAPETVKTTADRAPELVQPIVGRQRTQAGLTEVRASGLVGHRKLKMTPELVDKARRMYNSQRFNVAEIAQFCAVSPTTIYRHLRAGQATTH